MIKSCLGGCQGKYAALDEDMLSEIEAIIIRCFRPKDPKGMWTKCREATGKKCQALRKHSSK